MPSFSTLAFSFALLAYQCQAARPFLNEPDTGITTFLGTDTPAEASGALMPLDDIIAIPDFEFAARAYMSSANYSYYRTGAAGEFSMPAFTILIPFIVGYKILIGFQAYRSNLETYNKVKLRPRVLRDITGVPYTLNTTILGYNFSAPFFISPAAKAGKANAVAEPSLFATLSINEIAAAKAAGQVTFQQIYVRSKLSSVQTDFDEAEAAGSKAIVWSVDNAWGPTRSRSARWTHSENDYDYLPSTWELYETLKNMTSLPIIPKGIQTVEDALLAVEHGAPAIFISNHGGRQLDTSQSTMEIIMEIYNNAPQVFNQTEVLADCGVRYGTDVLKLLAMGVKAVGMGRPFMYSNIYGADGVARLIDMMKDEIIADAGNLGIANVSEISPAALNLNALQPLIYTMS
ncbi:hypothetical protein BP6252_08814 [Coleophoma cylindrospora]|uniref:FMN hydroxy acid dehydrogenase domain-containing protein n=1 Tax=Coleophoma cylindrospora TaxID=1849047 RepID=A0A3D8R7I4_9HELO|nr:hypothetical protein BP6252_08814 [Coleophoma cylindrospora]